MSLIRWKPVVLHRPPQQTPRTGLPTYRCSSRSQSSRSVCYRRPRSIPCLKFPRGAPSRLRPIVRAADVCQIPSLAEVDDAEVLVTETFQLEHYKTVEGKVTVRLDPAGVDANGNKWTLAVGCTMEGKWTLHWGVTYFDDIGSEWDQPPPEMRPPDSVLIKDYAIETPFKKVSSSSKGDILHEVHIDFGSSTPIAAIHFVLKEEETGSWLQHEGRDFRISFTDDDDNGAAEKQGFSIWPGAFSHISNLLSKAEGPPSKQEDHAIEDKDALQQNIRIAQFYKEFPVLKKELVSNNMTVIVKRCNDSDKKLVLFDTDLPGDVIVHWGICKNDGSKWVIPSTLRPPATRIFRQRALQTLLQQKEAGVGSHGLFLMDEETSGLVFVVKYDHYTWLNNMGTDFYVPMESVSSLTAHEQQNQPTGTETQNETSKSQLSEETEKVAVEYTYGLIHEIRNLVTDISPEKGQGTTSREEQEIILKEIEMLASEAYDIFRSSIPGFVEPETIVEPEKPAVPASSGTGSGHEILCQGFNWESHKSGRWYSDLCAKTKELASLGFTVVWLPPPTESVSPEGYMPKDLYNLNSRYGNMEELRILVKSFHEVGIKVLGDAVLNHRCAHSQNEKGIWNVFGGRLSWDSRAVVSDDPHFQGRGNKSSGANFDAAPNIDHSQEFVRNDIKEWLRWLRKEVGYDGWRLDFVRGFWGGYVKEYLESSEPYFSVGEYWDSLSYKYGEMEHNQDAHRQKIVDWIKATNGASAAFDVTTKGVLHSAIERCEYWRLCDKEGKPPGVVGWWPSRSVTFIENHDTGSTQGHWRFPGGKEMQGYAYILTHPGTPAVFYDHVFSHNQGAIANLIKIRQRNSIHCRSAVKITKWERDVYAAHIDEKIAVKLGPGHYQPNGSNNWAVVAEGADFKVWEKSS